jgi:hypothetical protein
MAEGMTCYERDEVFCEDQMCLRAGCRLQNERLSAESKTPAKFTITWEGGRYFVSIPNYKGGEVVPADLVEPLVEALRASQAALAMMTAPKSIMATSTAQAYANAYAAECKARAALSSWEAAQ